MSENANLDETVKTRVRRQTKELLEELAEKVERKPADLHRTILRDGLERMQRELEAGVRGR